MMTCAKAAENCTFKFYVAINVLLSGSRLVCGNGNTSSADRTSVAVNTRIFTVQSILGWTFFKQAVHSKRHHTVSVLYANDTEMYASMSV